MPGTRSQRVAIRAVKDEEDVAGARSLVAQYAREWPGGDLEGPEFAGELADLESKYGATGSMLLVASRASRLIGCVAVRRLSDAVCELKRFYVLPEERNRGAGRQLIIAAITEASRSGYSVVRLSTAPSMHAAQRLYLSLGFHNIDPYSGAELPPVACFELAIETAAVFSDGN